MKKRQVSVQNLSSCQLVAPVAGNLETFILTKKIVYHLKITSVACVQTFRFLWIVIVNGRRKTFYLIREKDLYYALHS